MSDNTADAVNNLCLLVDGFKLFGSMVFFVATVTFFVLGLYYMEDGKPTVYVAPSKPVKTQSWPSKTNTPIVRSKYCEHCGGTIIDSKCIVCGKKYE